MIALALSAVVSQSQESGLEEEGTLNLLIVDSLLIRCIFKPFVVSPVPASAPSAKGARDISVPINLSEPI